MLRVKGFCVFFSILILFSVFATSDETVKVVPLGMDIEDIYKLEDSILLFFTGKRESTTSSVLKDQVEKTESYDHNMIGNLKRTKQIGLDAQVLLENGLIQDYGRLMHEHWMNKRKRSPDMSNPQIDEWYELGLKSGATGGKLVGAGGGGFILFVTDNAQKLRDGMQKSGLEEMRFQFDFEGTKRII